ncbi:MAG: hypothetical protein E7564_10420 [Ruminococcaceae bacterium]|nr:hypothetical protein [Oscillospiraceae bacterium]
MKKTIKFMSFLLCILLISSLFTGCNVQEQIENVGDVIMQEYPVTIGEVTVNQKPKKVVVLTDALADAVIASGFETSLIAAPEESDHNNFKTLTKINPEDTASIIALTPDLIISNVYSEEQKAAFTEAQIPFVTINLARNREDYERLYKELGAVLGGSNTGANNALENARSIFTTLDDLQRIIPESIVVKTACYIFDTEGKGVTGDMLAGTVMNYCGLSNIFAGGENGEYDIEDLKIIDPQYIFCPIGLKEEIMKNKEFKDLDAVVNDRVFEVEEKLAKRNGRSIITFATTIAGIAYPELLEESTTVSTAMDPDDIADDKNEVLYQMGDSGDDIESFQKRLSQLGYFEGEVTRVFDENTQKAIRFFQKVHGLEVTMVMDELTLETLSSDEVIIAPGTEEEYEGYDPTQDEDADLTSDMGSDVPPESDPENSDAGENPENEPEDDVNDTESKDTSEE